MRILPPVLCLMIAGAMGLARVTVPGPILASFPATLVGILPMIAGLGLSGAGAGYLLRSGANVRPFYEPTKLVTGGPFRFSRHPVYLGLTLLLFGWAILLGALAPLVGAAAFLLLADLFYVRSEERALRRMFPDAYQAYVGRTRRWL